jgi:gamma-glutamyltranspeptidase/glutathione hydrolase
LLITGSPGGRTIINTVLDIVLNVTEFGMNVRQAVDQPRMHHQWLPDNVSMERASVSAADSARLVAMGHNIRMGGVQGDGHSIFFDQATGTAWGANDRRSGDSKVGVPR